MREGTKVALLSLGTRLAECLKAAEELGDTPQVQPLCALPSAG
jgi:deoxyxylulose-5-phosphate synthase